MNERTQTAIAARANEAQLETQKIVKDLQERFAGQLALIGEGKHSRYDFLELSRILADAAVKLAIAEDKIQTVELVKAFSE